jgi:hypothetical protein
VERDRGDRGAVLFIPYRAGQIAALRAAISAWTRIAIFAAMDRAEHDQRLWFAVDELDALGQIDGLKDALARLRKFGGRCVLGFQSIAQVATTYGEGDAHTIVENCGNSVIFRCSASEGGGTSRFASTLIGQREVRRATVSHSRRPTELFGTTTRSEHLSIEPAVMDSEVEQLPDLCGYLKFASRPEWLGIRLQPADRPGAAAVESPAHVPIEMPTGAAMSASVAPPASAARPGVTPMPRPSPSQRRSSSTRAVAKSPSAHAAVQSRRGARGRGADSGAAPELRGPEP